MVTGSISMPSSFRYPRSMAMYSGAPTVVELSHTLSVTGVFDAAGLAAALVAAALDGDAGFVPARLD